MKPSLLIEAKTLIEKLGRGGKKKAAEHLGWNPSRITSLSKGEEPRCAGGWKAREELTQYAVCELRKMVANMKGGA